MGFLLSTFKSAIHAKFWHKPCHEKLSLLCPMPNAPCPDKANFAYDLGSQNWII
ncbi:hypothetical protein NIES37_15790 [Tolypothrix tenuis PCC 7101]|uniref:Uncharacterized protein n=1 Tax=Tolypothrix tenuis PCC 7101 TaxID=231146 RepID=A0A1Z4MW04_9CYAN|nr:hypothetical protein NIES37_15790 [Tolypothrix tenuis PCC 7101]BAZ71857.1 hypothetical protein NIES50_04040 [Aulosira laxa NIES-50]